MIQAIFFATFDVNEGPKVLHQVPNSSITASPSTPSIPLLHFPSISNLIIPHPTLCNTGLLQFTSSHHRILSYPQHIASPRYPRNAYTFNFCLVLPETLEFSSYVPVIRKLNLLFRTLEEQEQFLSRDGTPAAATESQCDTGKIYALCEILLEDLNNYCEAMIPIDGANTLNIKLFPTYPPPPPLYAHHVPLATVRLEDLVDENWDLTMLRVLPWIDGVNSVRQISLLADADFKLVKKAIRHLLYYGCVLLLDVFSFGAVYAPTSEIREVVGREEIREEGRRYVALEAEDGGFGSDGADTGLRHRPLGVGEDGAVGEKERVVSGTQLAELYLSIKHGQSVKSWCMEHADMVAKIDIRRFITFGVIKGFLYRVHKYAFLAPSTSSKLASSKRLTKANLDRTSHRVRKAAATEDDDDVVREEDGAEVEDADFLRYLDGTHCFDEICTDLMISEKELMVRLKTLGDVQIICR